MITLTGGILIKRMKEELLALGISGREIELLKKLREIPSTIY